MLSLLVGTFVGASRSVADEHAGRQPADRYAQQLAALADQYDREGLRDAAHLVRNWQPPRPADTLLIFTSDSIYAPGPESTAPQVADPRFGALREEQAETLYKLAKQAATEGRGALALMLLVELLREQPDHAAARKMLGYEQAAGSWYRAGTLRRLRGGQVWHARFGWLPKEHVARYENGQRQYAGRWLSADEDARLHDVIGRGWEIETEHFQVTTNHSREAGVQLAVRLERLYDVWWQVFAGYHTSDSELARMFQQQSPPRRRVRPHKVVYFRDRDQYRAALAKMQPGAEETLGIYFADRQTTYFFAGDEQDPGTLFHEATHQLFQESQRTRPVITLRDNFWIVEGIACYTESLRLADGYGLLGGHESGRLPAARVRALDDGFYVPFDEMVSLDAQQIQRHPRIRTLYSQAAGQATFLMHHDAGRYREALSEYLQTVYRGAARSTTLAQLAGADYAELDRQYRAFLQRGSRR